MSLNDSHDHTVSSYVSLYNASVRTPSFSSSPCLRLASTDLLERMVLLFDANVDAKPQGDSTLDSMSRVLNEGGKKMAAMMADAKENIKATVSPITSLATSPTLGIFKRRLSI